MVGPSRPATASFPEIAAAVKPAVVHIAASQAKKTRGAAPGGRSHDDDPLLDFFHRYFDGPQQAEPQEAFGSGVIIRADGAIVTNAHLLEGADEIVVTLEDGRKLDARIAGSDEKTDVALLQIDGVSDLPVAKLGDSARLRVGEWVLAIGNPFGLSETVTAGIVSAKARVLGAGPYDDFIQTDASINPGNSGGPLVDMNGEVVGINTVIFSDTGGNIGIGFAIPIDLVEHVVAELGEHGRVVRGWIGISIQQVTSDLAESFDLDKATGALVSRVFADGPAAEAGMAVGDIVLEYDGKQVGSAHELPTLVADTEIGRAVEVRVLRGGEQKTLTIRVAEMPSDHEGRPVETRGGWGLSVADLDAHLARQLDLPPDAAGVVIVAVEADGPAARAGLRPGDLVARADGKNVGTAEELERTLAAAAESGRILLLVKRGDDSTFVVLRRE